MGLTGTGGFPMGSGAAFFCTVEKRRKPVMNKYDCWIFVTIVSLFTQKGKGVGDKQMLFRGEMGDHSRKKVGKKVEKVRKKVVGKKVRKKVGKKFEKKFEKRNG